MQTKWPSEEMLEAFRALGGTAENLGLDEGAPFALDPERPVLLRVPENLLLPLEAFEFAEGFLRLKEEESASQRLRDFFALYERTFGQTIFAQAATQIAALDALPADVKELLVADFGMGESFGGDVARRIESRFITRRAHRRGEQRVIAPVLELAKHDPRGLAIESDNGIRIGGFAPDGIRISYPLPDPLAIFQRFGFAAAQPVAFSLPMTIVSGETEISIGRDLHLGDRRGDVTMPQLSVVAPNSLALSHLMIGHSGFPRLSRGIFCARMRDADAKDPDAEFDRIAQQNTAKLLKLLDLLAGEEGPTILSLRRMARYQLEAMSWAIGTREI
jgi:hypothetical protein